MAAAVQTSTKNPPSSCNTTSTRSHAVCGFTWVIPQDINQHGRDLGLGPASIIQWGRDLGALPCKHRSMGRDLRILEVYLELQHPIDGKSYNTCTKKYFSRETTAWIVKYTNTVGRECIVGLPIHSKFYMLYLYFVHGIYSPVDVDLIVL